MTGSDPGKPGDLDGRAALIVDHRVMAELAAGAVRIAVTPGCDPNDCLRIG